MKPLVVLLATFAIAILIIKMVSHVYDIALAGRIGMSAMLVFTSVGHFVFTKGMSMMLPGFIPYKKAMVYITGVIEILAAIGLLIPTLSVLTAWLLIIFFIALLPANISAAIKKIDYQKGTNQGNGLYYLWFRIPLQVLFIVWAYISAMKFN